VTLKHKHHIVPKHIGGSDDPSNLVELTVEEHANAHKELYESHGRWQDYIAWKTLSGQIGLDDAIQEARGAANRGRKRLPEQIERIKEGVRKRNERLMGDPEKWAEINLKKSQAHKGKVKSKQHLANWSASRKGHKVSEETRDKIRKTLAETRAKNKLNSA
jgi:hypothetical protein